MSNVFCDCPLPAALTEIPAFTCGTQYDQIVRVFLQRKQAVSSFANVAAFQASLNWTPLIAAADDTKIVLSPFTVALTFPQSEDIKTGGGDNSTVFGLPEYQGQGNVTVTAMLKNLPDAVVVALDDLTCNSLAANGATDLTAYFVNRFGQIVSSTDFSGVDIYNLAISSVGSEGLNTSNEHRLSFDLIGQWDRGTVLTGGLDFDPLTLTP